MTPEQRANETTYCDYCHDGMQADGETPCPCVADREMVVLRNERDEAKNALAAAQAEITRLSKINVKLCADFNLMNQHGAKQDTEIARLTAKVAAAYEAAALVCAKHAGIASRMNQDQANSLLRSSEAGIRALATQPEADAFAAALATAREDAGKPRPVETAPKDGAMIRLLVDYEGVENWMPLTDDNQSWTIGFNDLQNVGEDEWVFVGWNWSQDCFQNGEGKVIGWLPFDTIAKSDDFVSLPRAEVEALMETARAFQTIRAVWTDPHNDNLMRKVSMTLDALQERMK